jgi:hypothetical protein
MNHSLNLSDNRINPQLLLQLSDPEPAEKTCTVHCYKIFKTSPAVVKNATADALLDLDYDEKLAFWYAQASKMTTAQQEVMLSSGLPIARRAILELRDLLKREETISQLLY